MKVHSHVFALFLLAAASSAYAAPPVAQFSCDSGPNFIPGESQVIFNPPAFKFNLSYFDLSVGNSSDPNSGSGASAGKAPVAQPLVLHAALARFVDLSNAVSANGTFSDCSLETTTPAGDVILFTLKSVRFQSASAIANSATQSAHAAAALTYGSIAIRIMQTGAD